MTEENDLTFRIITLGDSNVGKTSIIKKYLFNSLMMNHMLLLVYNFLSKL